MPSKSPLHIGTHASCDRHQSGWVEEVGKRVKKWMGAEEKILGVKSKIKKWEAEERLRALIQADENPSEVKPSSDITLRWFRENRCRPIKEPQWKASSKPKTIRFFENYILDAKIIGNKFARTFGDSNLGQIDRFTLQTHLNARGHVLFEKRGYKVSGLYEVRQEALSSLCAATFKT
jgi:hypothetical protein